MIYHRSALLLENNLTEQTSLFIKFHLCISRFVGAFFRSVCSPGEKVEGKISQVCLPATICLQIVKHVSISAFFT